MATAKKASAKKTTAKKAPAKKMAAKKAPAKKAAAKKSPAKKGRGEEVAGQEGGLRRRLPRRLRKKAPAKKAAAKKGSAKKAAKEGTGEKGCRQEVACEEGRRQEGAGHACPGCGTCRTGEDFTQPASCVAVPDGQQALRNAIFESSKPGCGRVFYGKRHRAMRAVGDCCGLLSMSGRSAAACRRSRGPASRCCRRFRVRRRRLP
jgi:hypothetical protein